MASLPEDTPDVEEAREVTSKDHHSDSITQKSDVLTETPEEMDADREDEQTERIISHEEVQKLEASCREKLIKIHAFIFQLANNRDGHTVRGNEIDYLTELGDAVEALSYNMSSEDRAQLLKDMQSYVFQCVFPSPGPDSLQRMLDATNNYVRRICRLPFMPGHAEDDTSGEDREDGRRRFLSTQAMMQDVLDFCDMTLKDETNLCQRLGDLNAGVAALLAAIREIPPQVRRELHSDVAALHAAVLQIVQSTLHGEDVKPAIEQYTQVMHKLTFVLDHYENRETVDKVDKDMKTAYNETVDLLTLVHAVAADCGGRGEGTLVTAGTETINVAQALFNAVQITASTIHTPQCKRVVFQLATELVSVLDNVVKTAIAVSVSPEEYQQKLKDMKMAAAKNVQFLMVAVQSQGVPSTNHQVRERKKILKTFYDHKFRLNSVAKKAYEDIMELVLSVYEAAAVRGGEAGAALYQRAATVTNQAQELFITAQLFAFTSNAAEFKHQVLQFIQDLRPALDDIVQAMFDGWTPPDEHVRKKAEELKEVVDRSLQLLLSSTWTWTSVQDRFEGEDRTSSAKQDETIEQDMTDSRIDKEKFIDLAKKAHEKIEALLTIMHQAAMWQEEANTELTTEGSNIALLAQELLNSVQLTITTNHTAKGKRVVQLLAKHLMAALDNLVVLMYTTWREDYRTQVEERKEMADQYLISLMDALQDSKSALNAKQNENKELTPALLHVERLQNLPLETYGYPEKARKLHIIFEEANGSLSNHDEYSAVQQLITDIFSGTRTWGSGGKSLKDMLTTFCTVLNSPTDLSSEKNFSQPLWQRVQCLNAAFARLLAAVRDSQAPNYVVANQAMADMTKLLLDIVIDIKYVWAHFIQQQGEMQDSIKVIYKFCSVIRSLVINIDSEKSTYHLSEMYSTASNDLMSVLYKLAKGDAWILVRNVRFEVGPACQAAVALLAHAFSVAARGEGEREGGGCGLFLKGSRAAAAAQELLTSAQLTAVTTPSSVCKKVVIQNIQELSSALHMLDQEWPVGTQEDIVKYNQLKSIAQIELNKLLAVIDASPKMESKFENRHLNLCLHLYDAEQIIKNAKMDIMKVSPTIAVESTVDKALVASIGDKIMSLNAAVVILYRLNKIHEDSKFKFRFIESKENHERAVSCLNAIQLIIPEIISGLNQDKSYKSVIMKENLPVMCSAISSFIESLRLERNEELDAVVRYAKAASEVMSVYQPSTTTEAHEDQQRVLIQANAVFRLASLVITKVSSGGWPLDHDADKQVEMATKIADTFLTTAQRSFVGLEQQSSEAALRVATSDLSDTISELDQLCHQHEYVDDDRQRKITDFLAAVERLLPMLKLLDDDLYTEHY